MSSGLVGSSIHHGSNWASCFVRSIAVATSQTWLASIIRNRSGPISSRISAARAQVLGRVAADLHLHVAPAFGHGGPAAAADLVVGEAEPADRRRVGGEAVAAHLCFALGTRVGVALQELNRFLRRDRVGEVAEVDAADDLLRAHVGHELPQRLALGARPQVPHGVDQRGGGEVDRALLRPDPAQLRVAGDARARSGPGRRGCRPGSCPRPAARARARPGTRSRCRGRS